MMNWTLQSQHPFTAIININRIRLKEESHIHLGRLESESCGNFYFWVKYPFN